MTIKTVGIGIIAAVLLTAAGTTFTPLKTQEAKHPVKGRVKWHAEQAKQKNRGDVTLMAPVGIYSGSASDLEDALSNYSVVIAQPVAEQTAIFDEENTANDIVTWHKLRVIEYLSRNTNTPQSFPKSLLPERLLPLRPDEVLVNKIGGALNVDGVKLTMTDGGFPPLSKNKQYLMFLAIEASGFASVGVGPGGVFTVEGNNKLRPHGKGNKKIATELEARFGGSVDSLRTHLSPKY